MHAHRRRRQLHPHHRSGADRSTSWPSPEKAEQPQLVWRPRLGEQQAYPLTGRITKVGRHDENDVVLAGPTVSARHATVRIEPIGVVLEDEGSLNGTFVNGERIEQRLLEEGDRHPGRPASAAVRAGGLAV